jgi:methyl-accepting chemotaxis protein
MEDLKGIFDDLEQTTSNNPTESSTETGNSQTSPGSQDILTELIKTNKNLQQVNSKINQIDERIKEAENSLDKLLKISVLSTLSHHSQVYLNPRRGTPVQSGQAPKII